MPKSDPSLPAGGRYFVTLETQGHEPWLAVPRTREVLLAVLRAWHEGRNGRVRAANVLPDHVHVLLDLPDHFAIDQTVTGWKSAMRRGAGYAETFQSGFRGHRLAESENADEYALYIYLKPYRVQAAAPDQTWPGWWAPESDAPRFAADLLPGGLPPAEWVAWPAERFATIRTGE